jgi:hypothetical protein
MTAPIAIKNLAGDTPADELVTLDGPSVPPDFFTVWRTVLQLQNTVNELISRFNAHYHAETLAAVQVWSGGIVTAGTGLSASTTAGELRKADGTFQAWTASSNLALTAADGTKDRTDLIQVATANGTISKKNGTLATAGQSVAPAADTGNVGLATVLVAAGVSVPGTITDVRTRPGVDTGAAPAPALQVDGTGAAATNKFTAS